MKAIWMSVLTVSSTLLAGPALAASGAAVYKNACAVCHDVGVGGAPKLGDKPEWSARLKQGTEALHTVGLKGKPNTAMVAKGGRTDLSDADVKAAVDFMIDRGR